MYKLPFVSVMTFLFSIILINVNGQSLKTDGLEKLLFELPGVIFEKAAPSQHLKSTYILSVKQPLDHDDPSKGFFYQKVFLRHRGFDRPTVMVTEGYGMWENSDWDITELLNANQIKVEHRFYRDSKPDTLDYSYLNLKQATADYHHVRQLFRDIYSEKWISTGSSKGGATAIVYRYFYPEDIDVCVPHVAPIITSAEDERFISYLETAMDPDCYEKARAFQVLLLENRDRIIPLVKFFILGSQKKYNLITIEQAFEYGVTEYPSSFMESGLDCKEIPGNEASIEDIAEHFLTVQKIHYYSDGFINSIRSYLFQAASELGNYALDRTGIEDLIVALPDDINLMTEAAFGNMSIEYDGKLMNDVNEWLKTDGDRFIYIYGTRDFWTAGAVTPNDNVDSQWFFMKDKKHLNAVISEMTDNELKRLISTLEEWLSLEIENIFYNKE